MTAHAPARTSPMSPRQHGVTLIVALIFMIVLTLFVTAGARSTMMQERMSGYSWEQALAFQAAEHALRQGEIKVGTTALVPTDLSASCTDGFCASNSMPDWNDESTWSDGANYRTATLPPAWTQMDPALAEAPKYYIEYAGGGMAAGAAGNKWEYYRVMARGVGRVQSSQAVLISTYRP